MFMSKFLKSSLALIMVLPALAYAEKSLPDFEFQDTQCVDSQASKKVATSTWRDGYQEVELETVMNCSYSAQRPEYKISSDGVVFKYETTPIEEGAISLCECTHKVLFRLKVGMKLSAKIYEDSVEIPVEDSNNSIMKN